MVSAMAGALKYFIERLEIDTSDLEWDFDTRFEIQKRVKLLQLEPAISRFINYDFGMYVRGPYSRFLAEDYYNLSSVIPVATKLSARSENYLRMVSRLPTSDLELLSSIAQVMSFSRNAPDESIVGKVKDLKPKFELSQIRASLGKFREFQRRFDLTT